MFLTSTRWPAEGITIVEQGSDIYITFHIWFRLGFREGGKESAPKGMKAPSRVKMKTRKDYGIDGG